jgi:hypothetical protein
MLKTRLSKVNNPRPANPLGDKGAPESRRRRLRSPGIHQLAETLWAQGIHVACDSKPDRAPRRPAPLGGPSRKCCKSASVKAWDDARSRLPAPGRRRFAVGNRVRSDGGGRHSATPRRKFMTPFSQRHQPPGIRQSYNITTFNRYALSVTDCGQQSRSRTTVPAPSPSPERSIVSPRGLCHDSTIVATPRRRSWSQASGASAR